MVECAAAGVPPHLFYDYTLREVHVLLGGAGLVARRAHKLAAFSAYHAALFHQNKKAKVIYDRLLRRLEPVRDMTGAAIRSAIMGMAKSMGAIVVVKKPKD